GAADGAIRAAVPPLGRRRARSARRTERRGGRGGSAVPAARAHPAILAAGVLSFWLGRRSRTDDEPRPSPIALWSRPAWSDEFGGPKGALPDPERWAFETGNNGGWGNRELEVYCAP